MYYRFVVIVGEDGLIDCIFLFFVFCFFFLFLFLRPLSLLLVGKKSTAVIAFGEQQG
jgi:hypothetical protein